jgi:hypothetical protein
MRKTFLALSIAAAVAAVIVASAALATREPGKNSFKAELNGNNEVVGPGSISTNATGTFRAKLRDDPPRLDFTLTYSGIEGGTVTQSHPHFAQRHVGGGIFGFFCGGPKPPCPTPGGTVEGTWTAADIIGPATQGVAATQFDEFVRALRAGAVYVNVHSSTFPAGEIRGQVSAEGE